MGADTENRFLKAALKLQQHGFRIFPLVPNTKDPLVEEFSSVASNDPDKARLWWSICPLSGRLLEYNIGISCRNLADGRRLVGVDVDNKLGRCGDDDLLRLELQGKCLPDTYEQITPSGGRHLVYWTREIIGNSKQSLANGVDIRGRGGFLVGAGSEIDGEAYTANFASIAEAPEWLISALARLQQATSTAVVQESAAGIDRDHARRRAEALVSRQKGVPEGERGSTAYGLACRVRDYGLDSYATFEVLQEWAERCDPPMPEEDLIVSVENAYRYARDKVGNSAPELAFPDEEPEPEKIGPIEQLNKEFAFVLSGGGHKIIREMLDEKGVAIVDHLKEESFHKRFAHLEMQVGVDKKGKASTEAVTKVWIRSPKRRTYDGFVFRPGLSVDPRFYNCWRGFKYEPLKEGEVLQEQWKMALDMLLQHVQQNVCDGDEELFKWVMGYFAHAVQRPWEKPRVALVFQGRKGIGKSRLVEIVGALFGQHFLQVANPRFLTGNFNSYLEQNVIFVAEEAFWSGDKSVDGILKHLITGQYHLIERKGQEPYQVDNCTRVVIIGNEEWLVPATEDERRYAVFKVGEGRRRDQEFFGAISRGMEAGGYRLLLSYLMNFDLSQVDVNTAPLTQGLLDQKMPTLTPVQMYWYECLMAGEIIEGHGDGWPVELNTLDLRESFSRWSRLLNRRAAIPDMRSFGHQLRKYARGLERKYTREGYAYSVPTLEKCRKDFEFAIEQRITWE